MFDEYQTFKEAQDSLLLQLTEKDQKIQGLLVCKQDLKEKVSRLQNSEMKTVELPNSPINYCFTPGFKYVNVSIPSHPLLSTNVFVSPRFKKHTTCIGSRLLRKIGFTRGGLGKNVQGNAILVSPMLHTSREGLRYDVVSPSLSSLGLAESGNVVFVPNGIQSEEEPVDKCVKMVVHNKPKIVNIVIVSISQQKSHPSCYVHPKHKYVPYIYSHKNRRNLQRNLISWKDDTSYFQTSQRRCESQNHGRVLNIHCGQIDEWYWNHLHR